MHVLIVLTSHDQLGYSGRRTGVWLEEFAAPYYVFRDAGADVTLASPKGGQPPVDPASEAEDAATEASKRFRGDEKARMEMAETHRLAEISPDQYDALFFPGGHGPLWDLSSDNEVKRLIQAFDEEEKPIGAIGHGPAAFVNALGGRGRSLVENRKLTAFTNAEEAGIELTDVVPFALETTLKNRGAIFQKGESWTAFCVSDGNLVTGQNAASSEVTAKALLQLLGLY